MKERKERKEEISLNIYKRGKEGSEDTRTCSGLALILSAITSGHHFWPSLPTYNLSQVGS